jgi:hypothetical protein
MCHRHVTVPQLRRGVDGLVAGTQVPKRSQSLELLRNVEGAKKAHLLYKITLSLGSIYLSRLPLCGKKVECASSVRKIERTLCFISPSLMSPVIPQYWLCEGALDEFVMQSINTPLSATSLYLAFQNRHSGLDL